MSGRGHAVARDRDVNAARKLHVSTLYYEKSCFRALSCLPNGNCVWSRKCDRDFSTKPPLCLFACHCAACLRECVIRACCCGSGSRWGAAHVFLACAQLSVSDRGTGEPTASATGRTTQQRGRTAHANLPRTNAASETLTRHTRLSAALAVTRPPLALFFVPGPAPSSPPSWYSPPRSCPRTVVNPPNVRPRMQPRVRTPW